MRKLDKHGFGAINVLITFFVLALLVVSGWYVYSKEHKPKSKFMSTSIKKSSTSAKQKEATTVPVLGTDYRAPGHGANGMGFGTVKPVMINNNGDGSSVATNITWQSWGGAKAIGTGISDYYTGTTTAADGVSAQATIVAFNLGTCDGVSSYNAVTWYYPEYGQTFNPNYYWNTCTGQDVQ